MLEQQVANGREVLEGDITHSNEISRIPVGCEVGHNISFIHHKLIFRGGHNCSNVLCLADVRFDNTDQVLFLQRRYF